MTHTSTSDIGNDDTTHEDSQRASEKEYNVGILFVHGIGMQEYADTLLGFGEPLRRWLARWINGEASQTGWENVTVTTASIGPDPAKPDAPAHAELRIRIPSPEQDTKEDSWLLAETWWARSFTTPSYKDLTRWGAQVVPWTIAAHFAARLRRAYEKLTETHGIWQLLFAGIRTLYEVLIFLAGLALMPVFVLLVILLLIIGAIPIARVRSFVGNVQRKLTGTVGDSFVLLENPIKASAILTTVREDLDWLCSKCEHVAVVAHSQGAAVAHAVLRSTVPPECRVFISLGSGLNKLLEIKAIRQSGSVWTPWMAFLALILLAVSLPAALQALWAMGLAGFALLGAFVVLLTLGTGLKGIAARGQSEKDDKQSEEHEEKPSVAAILGISFSVLGVVSYMALLVYFFLKIDPQYMIYPLFFGSVLAGAAGYKLARRQADTADFELSSNLKWVDLYASADPVPNGPLPKPLLSPRKVTSDKIYNRGSFFNDHTTYWQNTDGFVSTVATEVALVGEKLVLETLRESDQERLDVAKRRREWRVRWLTGSRTAVILLAAALPFALWPHLWSRMEHMPQLLQQAVIALDGLAVLSEHIPLLGQYFALPSDIYLTPKLIGVGLVFVVAFVIYEFLYLCWQWWNQSDIAALFGRQDFEAISVPFATFFLLLVAALEVGIFTLVGMHDVLLRSLEDPAFWLGTVLSALAASFATIFWPGFVAYGDQRWGDLTRLLASVPLRATAILLVWVPLFWLRMNTYPQEIAFLYETKSLERGRVLVVAVLILGLVWVVYRRKLRSQLEAWSYAGPPPSPTRDSENTERE